MTIISHKDKIIEFRHISGEVLDTQKYSETHVASSGGGGYIGPNGGKINATQVHSTSVTMHDFWIRDAAGREISIQLAGSNVALRPGQFISMLIADEKKSGNSAYASLINHTAGSITPTCPGQNMNARFQLDLFGFSTIVKGGALGLLMLIAMAWSWFAGLLMMGVFGFMVWKKFARLQALHAQIDAEVQKASEALLKRPPMGHLAQVG